MASGARAVVAAALALATNTTAVWADETAGREAALIPAGLYTPFQRVKQVNVSAPVSTSTVVGAFAESRDPNGGDSAAFCGGSAAGVADPTDYPAFMRYSMRASLKANYTADNVGFRWAGGAP